MVFSIKYLIIFLNIKFQGEIHIMKKHLNNIIASITFSLCIMLSVLVIPTTPNASNSALPEETTQEITPLDDYPIENGES